MALVFLFLRLWHAGNTEVNAVTWLQGMLKERVTSSDRVLFLQFPPPWHPLTMSQAGPTASRAARLESPSGRGVLY